MKITRPEFIQKLLRAPRRFEGGLIANALGFHLIRIAWFELMFALRGKIVSKDARVQQAAETVMRDGIAVIHDFFPPEVFSSIKAEVDRFKLDVFNERAPRLIRTAFVAEGRPTTSALLEMYFAKNAFINGVASVVLRKKHLITPTVHVEKGWYAEEDLGKESTDKADNLHFDVSYTTMKSFMYLNDVDAKNAAFTYTKGSQKMTLARLWMEYKMSVKFWFWDKKSRDTITPEVDHAFLAPHGLALQPIEGKANTLIIVNTQGFHCRGKYQTTTPREMVLMSYREIDGLKFFIQSLLKKK